MAGNQAVVFLIAGKSFGASSFKAPTSSDGASVAPVSAAQLLISDPLSDFADSVFSPTTHPYYSTARPDPADPSAFAPGILTHPLHMLLAHLAAIPSNLPPQWLLSLDLQAVDVAGILALARGAYAATPSWPGVVAGETAKPLNAFDWLSNTFLRPLGLAWAILPPQTSPAAVANQLGTLAGQLTLRALDDGRTMDRVLPLGAVLSGRSTGLRTEAAADAMQATTGAGLGSVPKLIINADQAYTTEFRRARRAPQVIEAQGLIAADDPGSATAFDGYPGVAAMRAYLSTLGAWVSRGMREFVVDTAVGTPTDPLAYFAEPGAVVVLSIPGIRGAADAAPQLGTDGAPRAYVVLEQAISPNFATQSLRLAQLGYAPTRIAPAALAETVNASTDEYEVICDPSDTILPDFEDSPYQTALYAALDDGETFATIAGPVTLLEIQFLDETLKRASKGAPILSYDFTTNAFTVDQPEEIASTSPYVPTAGDWVVLTYQLTTEYPSLSDAVFGL